MKQELKEALCSLEQKHQQLKQIADVIHKKATFSSLDALNGLVASPEKITDTEFNLLYSLIATTKALHEKVFQFIGGLRTTVLIREQEENLFLSLTILIFNYKFKRVLKDFTKRATELAETNLEWLDNSKVIERLFVSAEIAEVVIDCIKYRKEEGTISNKYYKYLLGGLIVKDPRDRIKFIKARKVFVNRFKTKFFSVDVNLGNDIPDDVLKDRIEKRLVENSKLTLKLVDSLMLYYFKKESHVLLNHSRNNKTARWLAQGNQLQKSSYLKWSASLGELK